MRTVHLFSSCLLLAAIAAPQVAADIPAARPSTAETLTPERRGDIHMARKEFREAVEMYQQGPKDSAILVNKIGIAYHQMTMLDQARKYYERAAKMKPDYAEAINNLGTIHYARRSYRKATGIYQRALKHAPQSASIYSNLGTAWFARKKYDRALEAYTKAMEIDPDVFDHRSAYGTLLQERSVQEKAKFHFYMARTYAKQGMNERALQYLRMAFENGFKEREQVLEAPEFEKLRETAEFKDLMANAPRVL